MKRGRWIAVAAAGAVLSAAAIGTGAWSERYFSSTAFCISCHSMTYPYEALKRSVHYGRLGIRPECGDCHLPPDPAPRLLAHATEGIKDIINTYRLDLGTKEAFDAHKEEFARKAADSIRRWNGAPCRRCHADPAPRSEFGRAAHKTALTGTMTCVDCHGRTLFHPD